MTAATGTRRLVEVDALRGIAALSVVLFHYTTRFNELFGELPLPMLSFAHGHLGVNLFFIISGFVIFMTLERTLRPMDFVISRFSRLFPAYWFAILLTFLITHALGLPGKLVGVGTAVGNMLMFHGVFGMAHVDGVYWTLEVELLFYCGMFLLYRVQRLDLVNKVLLAMLLLRVGYFISERVFGVDLPWMIFRFLILRYIPWFAIGISIYQLVSRGDTAGWAPLVTIFCALATLLLVEPPVLALIAAALGALVYLAASGRAPVLRIGPLVWLGSISYPLYLLHENIGWSMQLRLRAYGLDPDQTVVVVVLFSLGLAWAVTAWIEQPAMRWIRQAYGRRRALA
ncbi:acyltransferase [Accumulibacter sp.]|uniref:acyltransferase family protein n=1 Tax=Accumulibacter sp. TaxID=2053492 RepID=UPI0025DB843F|nr:acyltransferase [Accumulibacter sp.]MCM8595410.1 acyltransferase [Accumulibacter sp.]MCM8626409.1 acyltransferase [Accumulibacter sp.]MDS4049557.1 acyltransferase [Accumulibacter sp.]